MSQPASARLPARIDAIDVARAVALGMMAVYHFGFDLLILGFWSIDVTSQPGWVALARATAASFLFLAGVGIVLATREGVRWGAFLRRLGMVGGAAALISAITWFAIPDAWIFHGILHMIALGSVLALGLRLLPWYALVTLAVFAMAAPSFAWPRVFDHPGLWFLGLARVDIFSNDFVPVFPWMAPMLLGLAAGKVLGALPAAPGWTLWRAEGRVPRAAAFLGRHSLAVYLVHQPIFFAVLLPLRWWLG